MSPFIPEKLSVELRDGVITTEPINHRRYTLTHSDITAELFLTIGLNYAYDKINTTRDEVFAEWSKQGESYSFYTYLHVDDPFNPMKIGLRDYIFRHELPLALKAIRYGDTELFKKHPELDSSPIIVYFMSSNPLFNRLENWGTFSDYK
ncbi:staygreen family protein [Clostridium sp. cel8]|jgi:hypothetical protein|uniref:staygreen family protein n=1 Tax=Clostridium sp. cel8 TaxID=2663123 RepID=UPI0015F43EE8|nr:staygreen family protein [Clostridium sp. cel8]MBA5849857.1 staygreen family protein [Clostridium sp. cel8]